MVIELTGRIDYHIHTKLCRHATGEMEDYVQVAISKSLEEIGFSDHFIMTYLPAFVPKEEYCMREEELPTYINNVEDMRDKHTDITIKLGIEADYYEGKEKTIRQLLSQFKFDYIYGSVHVVGKRVIDDEKFRKLLREHEILELYQNYFKILKKAIQSGLFDVIAHFDLPKKFGDRPNRPITELTYEVIEALAKHKVCIELSTAGLRKPVKEQYPSIEILQACFEKDIPITIGSDSHNPNEVGWELDRALEMLREIGYSQVVGFEKHKKIFFDI